MTRIITFLGQVGNGNRVLAVAAAKWFAQRGQRVLLVTHPPDPGIASLLQTSLQTEPQLLTENLSVVRLQSTTLLEQGWGQLKPLLNQYLPSEMLEGIYPGELIILPGFDSLLAFNALRDYFVKNEYDVILYDGQSDLGTLRLLGLPEALDWYFRRFRQAMENLDIAKIAASLGGPIASALLSANIDSDKVQQGLEQVKTWIAQGVTVVSDARQLTAYLVTGADAAAIAQSRWLWGSAQQVNLGVSGVLVYPQGDVGLDNLQQNFAPLGVHGIPPLQDLNWQPLLEALPDLDAIPAVPPPLQFDREQRQILVFLPGFQRHQVKLTQYGSDLTVEAGDQRRNISLPEDLKGQQVKAGKFEEPYLIIAF